jgi:hypothetical protein
MIIETKGKKKPFLALAQLAAVFAPPFFISPLPINLTKHQIHRTNHRHSIGQQMALGNSIETTQVSEARSANVAPVRTLATITDDVDTHLALGGLDGGVSITGRDGVALGVEKEVVDEGLHVLLHSCSGRRGDLVVLHADGAGGHLVQALVDDAQRLTELFHTDEISVVAVTVGTNGHIKFDLVVGIIRLALSDIPRYTGATQHGAGEGEVQSLGGRNDTNTPQSLNPDTVVRKHLLGLINTVTELSSPLVDVIEKTNGDILVNTTRADVGSVQTGTGDSLVEFLKQKKCM